MKELRHKLPTFQQITLAVDGDECTINKLLNDYDAYISKACLRPFYDEYGNVYIVVDLELKGRIREALMQMFLSFEIKVK
ncbi:MAG: helix-turn-helix domain-containing protein [Longicatena sp.]